MKILLLLSLVALSVGHPAVLERDENSNSASQGSAFVQEPSYSETAADEKKVDKRSYGWGGGWPIAIHSVGWPWYGGHGWSGIGHGGWSGYGHGWYGGWPSHGWPIVIPSYGHGWHSKW